MSHLFMQQVLHSIDTVSEGFRDVHFNEDFGHLFIFYPGIM